MAKKKVIKNKKVTRKRVKSNEVEWGNTKRMIKLVDVHGNTQQSVIVDASIFEVKHHSRERFSLWNTEEIIFPYVLLFGSDIVEIQLCTGNGFMLLRFPLKKSVQVSPGLRFHFPVKGLYFKKVSL